MRKIDPRSTLSPEASIKMTTANGVIVAQIFELHMQVINVPEQELCAFASQRVAVAPQFPRVSGDFPWAHCYLASQPHGSTFWVGNIKSHVLSVLRNVTAGLGSGQLTA